MGTDKIYLSLDILSPMSDLISFSPHPTEECHAQNCQIYHFTPAHCLSRDLPDRPAGIPPSTLDEVHFKIFVLRQFKGPETSQELVEILLDDLEQTPSNNTTRQWITALLKRLSRAPVHQVEPRLMALIQKGLFSYRLKKKIEAMLDQMWEDMEFD